jgi:hypothetical protein
VARPEAALRLLGEQALAGCRATSASLCADPAMLHFRAMAFADRAADLASLDTGAQLRASQFEVRARKTRNDACRGQANISAIIAIADALDYLRDLFFAEAGVGAGIAGFGAGIAGGNALDVNRVIRGRIHGMRVEHLFDVAHKRISRWGKTVAAGRLRDSTRDRSVAFLASNQDVRS